MIVSGDEAKNFNAVRLDNFQNANRGPLVEADSATGRVLYPRRDWHSGNADPRRARDQAAAALSSLSFVGLDQ